MVNSRVEVNLVPKATFWDGKIASHTSELCKFDDDDGRCDDGCDDDDDDGSGGGGGGGGGGDTLSKSANKEKIKTANSLYDVSTFNSTRQAHGRASCDYLHDVAGYGDEGDDDSDHNDDDDGDGVIQSSFLKLRMAVKG